MYGLALWVSLRTFQPTWGLSLLLQLCQNGRSLMSARGMELCRLKASTWRRKQHKSPSFVKVKWRFQTYNKKL
uniref:SFRICE_029167 n=1 Tax=Spodoptera frugiperda TaxID=7108 RepID=A0A2H1W180_SPOFR